MKLNINIENGINYPIPSENDIKQAILKVLKEKNLTGNFEIDVKFVDKKEIQELNLKYRNIDQPTDVLSFPIQEEITSDIKAPILLGDIVICPEMSENDILELIKHATLHLLGFHHPGN